MNNFNRQGSRFFDYFLGLAKDANGVVNSEKAKKIKKGLIISGAIGMVIAIALIGTAIGIFINAPSPVIMAPFMLGGFLLVISSTILYCGVGLTVVGVGTKFIDKSVKCPNCGDIIEDGEMYCSKCGRAVRANKTCPNCGTVNEPADGFCRKCGTKLDD